MWRATVSPGPAVLSSACMNELFDQDDGSRRPREQAPPAIDYDDELETIEPGYRYVLRPLSESSAGSSDP
jgi:hypothetical protein